MAVSTSSSGDLVSETLAVFASALRQPVHIVALLLLVVLVYEIGRLLTETWRRVRPGAPGLEQIATQVLVADRDRATVRRLAHRAPGPTAERAVLAIAEAGSAAEFENALAHFELEVQRRLDRTRILVRSGPAVGLMGTLIPLAPGLAELGKGNYKALAADLQVAFAATVMGLLVGTVAFVLTLVRSRSYGEDLVALERAIARVGEAHVA